MALEFLSTVAVLLSRIGVLKQLTVFFFHFQIVSDTKRKRAHLIKLKFLYYTSSSMRVFNVFVYMELSVVLQVFFSAIQEVDSLRFSYTLFVLEQPNQDWGLVIYLFFLT